MAAGSLVINEFIGRRVKLYWPEEGGWFEAIISDYNAGNDEHCLTYNINTPNESFEWVNLRVSCAQIGLLGHTHAPVARYSRCSYVIRRSC
jgi:hypothetical protein